MARLRQRNLPLLPPTASSVSLLHCQSASPPKNRGFFRGLLGDTPLNPGEPELLETVQIKQPDSHRGAIDDLNSVLARDGIQIRFTSGRYIFTTTTELAELEKLEHRVERSEGPSEQADQLAAITGDGNVVGNHSIATVAKQSAGDNAIQIAQLHLTFSSDQLRSPSVSAIGAESTVKPAIRVLVGNPTEPPILGASGVLRYSLLKTPPFQVTGWRRVRLFGGAQQIPNIACGLYLENEKSKAGQHVRMIIRVLATPRPTACEFAAWFRIPDS